MPDNTKPVKLTVYVPADIRRTLRIEAAERGVSMGDVLVEALQHRITFLPRELRKEEKVP